MKIYERLKNYYLDKEYYVSFSFDGIYIIGYKNILTFDNKIIKIQFNNFCLMIEGNGFKITRKNNLEIEIVGSFSKMEILNEI